MVPDPLPRLIERWRVDQSGTYQSWFLWEERRKNFCSIADSGRYRSTLQYKLEIIPLVIQFEQADELEIDLASPDMAEVLDWIERKLQSFLDTYMRIESDPNYQRENQHVDPVCGMHVQAGRIAHKAENSRHTYYFCSQDCHEHFTASPESFLGLARIPVPAPTAVAQMPSV